MAVKYKCSEIDHILGACRDFNPSYPVGESSSDLIEVLFRYLSDGTGIDVETLKSRDYLLDKDLQLEEEDLHEILSAIGVHLEPSVDFTPLVEKGKISDLKRMISSAREIYLRKIAKCESLVGDSTAFREAGCKRRGHLMLPKGRVGLNLERRKEKEKKGYLVTSAKEERWAEDLPPFSFRTQSPGVRSYMSGLRSINGLELQIANGLKAYRRASKQEGKKRVFIPNSPEVLIKSGVPDRAAELISGFLGGQSILSAPRNPSPLERISRLFGGAAILISEQGTRFVLRSEEGDRVKITSLRGSVRRELSDLVRKAGSSFEGTLYLSNWSILGGPQPLPLSITDIGEAVIKLEALKRIRGDIQLSFRDGDKTRVIVLQHSELFSPLTMGPASDYNTLAGFTFSQLPEIIARRLSQPRKGRKERRASPLPAKRNSNMARRSKRNPRFPDYPDTGHPDYSLSYLSSDPTHNQISSYYYPGTIFDYYKEGYFPSEESNPVNRRNPRGTARKNRGRTQPHFTIASQTHDESELWPRSRQWSQVLGPYEPDPEFANIPPNRRNPSHGDVVKSRFPGDCALCGRAFDRGESITDSGRKGPRGGKKMAHVGCVR